MNNFFDRLGKKANEAYQATKEKTVNLTEEIKIKTKINEKNDKIEEIYAEIGKFVYTELKDGRDADRNVVTEKCNAISTLNDELEKLRADLLALKNIKKCVKCGKEMELNSDFCSNCGEKQPKVEPKVEVKNEEPANAQDANVIEINNVDENNNGENQM